MLFVFFYVLFVCKCVLYYCHRVLTHLQLTNISYLNTGNNWTHYCVNSKLRVIWKLWCCNCLILLLNSRLNHDARQLFMFLLLVVMLDRPCSEVERNSSVSPSLPSHASPCAIRFQLDSAVPHRSTSAVYCCWPVTYWAHSQRPACGRIGTRITALVWPVLALLCRQ